MRRWCLFAVLLLPLSAPALADELRLPTPEAARVQQDKLITAVGGRPDRLLASDVPGPVINDEVVRVGLAGDGAVASVVLDQRLRVDGEGDYAIRERGPARAASSLSGEPAPVTRRGAVVWQGFSPGRRDLAARLTLDTQLEATRLPLTVTVRTTGTRATVTVTNVTGQPAELPTATDVRAGAVAGLLDHALAVARRPSPQRLPSTDAGLPAVVEAIGSSTVTSVQSVPYRLTGSLRVEGAPAVLSGPTMTPDGRFAGTLGTSRDSSPSSVTFTADLQGTGRLVLDLTAVAALNPRELAPPGFGTWAAWAAAGPSPTARREALDLLVAVAATGARAASYGPYLGADLRGTGSTTFRYSFAPPDQTPPKAAPLHPRWGPISLLALAGLLVLAAAGWVWRRS